MKLILLLLLTGHSLGDYYLQSQAMAQGKETNSGVLLRHCLSYAAPFALLALLFRLDPGILGAAFGAVLLHGLIDGAKARFLKARLRQSGASFGLLEGKVYLIDQSLHWLTLFSLAYLLRGWAGAAQPLGILSAMAGELGIPWQRVLQWTLALLLIYKPSNITFGKLFSMFKPQAEPEGAEPFPGAITGRDKLRAGGIIGGLEKLICLMFLAAGEYMAIGLVLTAKSIARYDRISKSASFAEYYLIGTLSSLIMVLLIFGLVFQVLDPLPLLPQ